MGEAVRTNVELARRALALWNRGGVQALLEHVWAPDIVFYDSPENPDTGIFRGADEVAARLRDTIERLGHVQLEGRSLEERGDYTLSRVELTARGVSGGVALTEPRFYVSRWEDGRQRELRIYHDADQAREAYERLGAQSD